MLGYNIYYCKVNIVFHKSICLIFGLVYADIINLNEYVEFIIISNCNQDLIHSANICFV